MVGRQLGSYPETGFEEIRARAAFRRTIFPPTGLIGSQVAPSASFCETRDISVFQCFFLRGYWRDTSATLLVTDYLE